MCGCISKLKEIYLSNDFSYLFLIFTLFRSLFFGAFYNLNTILILQRIFCSSLPSPHIVLFGPGPQDFVPGNLHPRARPPCVEPKTLKSLEFNT